LSNFTFLSLPDNFLLRKSVKLISRFARKDRVWLLGSGVYPAGPGNISRLFRAFCRGFSLLAFLPFPSMEQSLPNRFPVSGGWRQNVSAGCRRAALHSHEVLAFTTKPGEQLGEDIKPLFYFVD